MIVCIAEKPSVAKDIAKVIGAHTQCDGYWEGNGYQVTWTFGHLCTLKAPHDYTKSWKQWNYTQLPMIPPNFQIKLIPQDSIKKQFKIIESLFKKAEYIINCGDAGQEGELIQRWVMQKAQVKCPVKRLWISSLTEEAIKDGFKHLKDQKDYQSLYEAGLARAIGDWLLGMNATRYYTLESHTRNNVMSVGRVQTPTLALIVNRQEQIDNFKPEDYWVLSTIYKDVVFSATKGKYMSESEANADLADISSKDFTITKVETKKASEGAPKLFDLTSLQVECNRRFGFSAEHTLSTIQSLYEKKYVTYPRVDTTFLPDDVYSKCPSILSGLTSYSAEVAPIIGKKLPKSKKVFDSKKVTDHHAIIPTGVPASSLTRYEEQVYDTIVRRFIAVFYPDCISSNTTVTGKIGKVEFKAIGKQILDYGWYTVFGKTPEGKMLPSFTKGEFGPHKPTLVKKQTTPPALYTEATLLRAMETAGKDIEDDDLRLALKENGIGRPSTRAAIIETLFKRNYITRQKKNLVPTAIGKRLIASISNPILKSAELTGQWEKKLRDIESKKYSAGDFIKELKNMTYQIVGKNSPYECS